MRQHAETPLEVSNAPGLVHLLRVFQEVGAGGRRHPLSSKSKSTRACQQH